MAGNGYNPAMDDNRIIQSLWVGGRLSALERLCVLSYCAHGHEFHLYHYDELQNVPQVGGLRLIDGGEILPRAAVFRHHSGSLAYFADQFRFELLRQRGGWWADMDTVCVRPLDIAAQVALARSFNARWIFNGVLKFPKGHFLAAAMADSYKDVNRVLPWDSRRIALMKLKRRLKFWQNPKRYMKSWHAGGMEGLMRAVRHFGLEEYLLPVPVFFPKGDPSGRAVVESAGYSFDGLLSDNPDLKCLHFCNSNLRIDGVDKDGDYPPDSLYEVLKRRYKESEQ